jgi:hypothetical protein
VPSARNKIYVLMAEVGTALLFFAEKFSAMNVYGYA